MLYLSLLDYVTCIPCLLASCYFIFSTRSQLIEEQSVKRVNRPHPHTDSRQFGPQLDATNVIIFLVHESESDHFIRYWCLSVCLSVCPEHSSVGFDPILINFFWEVYIMI